VIIGISGKCGVGKTTVADLVVAMLNARTIAAVRVAFGDMLKDEVAGKFKIDLDLMYSAAGKQTTVCHPDLPNPTMTVGQVLQWYGTDVVRKADPDRWVRLVAEGDAEIAGTVVVVDDVRFPNEAIYCRKNQGILVRLDPFPGWKMPAGRDPRHESETALDGWLDWDFWPRRWVGDWEKIAEQVARRVKG
jgi:hypothetical protein